MKARLIDFFTSLLEVAEGSIDDILFFQKSNQKSYSATYKPNEMVEWAVRDPNPGRRDRYSGGPVPEPGGHHHSMGNYNNGFPEISHGVHLWKNGPVFKIRIGNYCHDFHLFIVVTFYGGNHQYAQQWLRIAERTDLIQLPKNDNLYNLSGSTPEHPSVHWCSEFAYSGIQLISRLYFTSTGKKMSYGPISLERGGYLDKSGTWGSDPSERYDYNVLNVGNEVIIRPNEIEYFEVLISITDNLQNIVYINQADNYSDGEMRLCFRETT